MGILSLFGGCAPLIADLCLYSYEEEFIQKSLAKVFFLVICETYN